MSTLLAILVSGIVATTAMTTFLCLIDKSGRVNANMARALGSALTRSIETSLLPGLIIQYLAGLFFALVYIYALSRLQIVSLFSYLVGGGIIGFAHGFVFSFIMVILAEHHPVEEFQNASFQVAIVHFLSHIIYGLFIGLVGGLILLSN
ncbi:MAG: hypothetical protein A2Y94_09275 [Caldithrix sp. RBG_13_44_9]|nr:MAG: hypothetical protein A2Y94_09275 [Caldithrix sp. RBG_13_44_9]